MKQVSNDAAGAGASFGTRLRAARESAGLSLEDVSSRLKMPLKVIRALEADDWDQAGAPVFVRGQLRSYARLLGVAFDPEVVRQEVGPVTPPELVSYSHVPRHRRLLEQATRRAVYIAITAAIAVPVWLATRPHLSHDVQVQSLEVETMADSPAVAPRPVPTRTPVVASMGGLGATPAAAAPTLSLAFTGDSWVQVFSPDGSSIEQGLLGEGERRSYASGEVGRIVLGNVAAVEVRKDGQAVDLSRFSRANVARFTLSSDGSLVPVVD